MSLTSEASAAPAKLLRGRRGRTRIAHCAFCMNREAHTGVHGRCFHHGRVHSRQAACPGSYDIFMWLSDSCIDLPSCLGGSTGGRRAGFARSTSLAILRWTSTLTFCCCSSCCISFFASAWVLVRRVWCFLRLVRVLLAVPVEVVGAATCDINEVCNLMHTVVVLQCLDV